MEAGHGGQHEHTQDNGKAPGGCIRSYVGSHNGRYNWREYGVAQYARMGALARRTVLE
jgi:hypothetical protein